MTTRRTPVRFLVGVTALALALTACSSDGGGSAEPEESEPTTGGTGEPSTDDGSTGDPAASSGGDVVAAIDAAPTTMNPLYDTATGQSVFNSVFDSLVGQFEEGDDAVPPRLAESWDSPDGATWTFDLVPDVVFHNGEPLTADDVVYTFETILGDDENPFKSRFPDLESVTAVNDTTVEFQLAAPRAAFPALLATVNIVPDEYYEEVGRDGFDAAPVGSGPYIFVEETTDSVVVEANPDYWGDAPEIGTLTFQVIESTSSAVAGLESGDVDVVANIPPGDVERLNGVDEISVESTSGRQVVFIGYNVNVPGLDDPNVRAAIDTAIDRQAIVDSLLDGQANVIGQPIPSSLFGYDDSIEATSYEPDAARELLAESDYAGEELVLYYPTSRLAAPDQVAQAIVGYLQEVGITARAEGLEWATLLEQWVGVAIDGMYLFPYINGGDPEVIIDSIFEEDSRNYFDDQEIFDLVVAQRNEVDDEARAELLSELFKASNEEVYYSWLYSPLALFGIREGVPVEASSTGRVWID